MCTRSAALKGHEVMTKPVYEKALVLNSRSKSCRKSQRCSLDKHALLGTLNLAMSLSIRFLPWHHTHMCSEHLRANDLTNGPLPVCLSEALGLGAIPAILTV